MIRVIRIYGLRTGIPRVFYTRTVIRDGSKYFVYTDGRYLFYLMKTLKTIFPLRSCDLPLTNETIAAGKYKVCLDFQIKRCEEYTRRISRVKKYGEYIKQTVADFEWPTRGNSPKCWSRRWNV